MSSKRSIFNKDFNEEQKSISKNFLMFMYLFAYAIVVCAFVWMSTLNLVTVDAKIVAGVFLLLSAFIVAIAHAAVKMTRA